MIIKNNTDHLILIPLDDSGRQVRPVVMGYSPISDEVWAKARPHLEDKLKGESLKELGTVSEKGAGNKMVERAKTLADLSQTEATKLIGETYDVKALNAWLKGNEDAAMETRESVRVVLQDRVKFMTDRSPASAVDDASKGKA